MQVLPYEPKYEDGAIECAREFVERDLAGQYPSFDAESARNTLRALFGSTMSRLFVLVDGDIVRGIAGGAIVPCAVNNYFLEFVEIVWFVSKQYRREGIKLFRALEKSAKEAGCSRMRMLYIIGSDTGDEVQRFYGAMGYKQHEIGMSKEI